MVLTSTKDNEVHFEFVEDMCNARESLHLENILGTFLGFKNVFFFSRNPSTPKLLFIVLFWHFQCGANKKLKKTLRIYPKTILGRFLPKS